MKNKLTIITFSIIWIFVIFSGVLHAQNTETKSGVIEDAVTPQELVLGIPKLTDKTLFLITGIIQETNGLKYETYCPKHNLILLTYNPKLFIRPEDVVESILGHDLNFQIFIKVGNFDVVKEMCHSEENN